MPHNASTNKHVGHQVRKKDQKADERNAISDAIVAVCLGT
jgi:hypothetical protein